MLLRSFRAWLSVVLGFYCSLCLTAQELTPDLAGQRLAEFQRRTLDDRALLHFLNTHLPSARSWDLDRLTLVALFYSPELDVVRARLQAAEAAVVTASTIPNPKVSFSLGFPLMIGLSLSLPADTAALRDLRTVRAELLTLASRAEFLEAAWSLRSRLRSALLLDYQLLRLAVLDEHEVELRGALLHWAEQRLELGEFSWPETETYRILWQRAEAVQRQTVTRKTEARGAVAQILGLPFSAIESLAWSPAAFENTIPLPDVRRLRGVALDERPDLQQLFWEYRAALADVQLEAERAEPIFQLGPGYQLDQGTNKFSLGFTVALLINDQNEGPIAERVARAKEVGARYHVLQDRAIGLVDQSSATLETGLAAYLQTEEVVQRSLLQEGRSLRLVTAGENDRSSLLLSRLETVLSERAQLEAQIQYQRQLGLLEDAIRYTLQGRLPEVLP